MQIREYRPAQDHTLLRECITELQHVERALDARLPSPESMVDAYIARLFDRCSAWEGAIFVACDDSGAGIGVASVFAHVPNSEPDEPAGTYALLSDLVVLPPNQGRGVAGTLLAAAEAFVRARGATVLRLEVMVGNSAAQSLYASHGYRERLLQLEKPLFTDAGER